MITILNWRAWAAIVLAGGLALSHVAAYRAGSANVRSAWDAEKLAQTQQLAASSAENRRIEQRRQSTLQDAQNAAKIRETTLRRDALAAGAAADGLRDELAAARAQLPGATCDAVRGRAAALSALLGQCADRYRGVAADAAAISSDSLMLQQAWPK